MSSIAARGWVAWLELAMEPREWNGEGDPLYGQSLLEVCLNQNPDLRERLRSALARAA